MRERIVAGVKAVLRPIVQQRALIERMKYGRTPIRGPQDGNDYIAASLASGKPAAIGKMGASELGALHHYDRCKDVNGVCNGWGFHRFRLHVIAGVYPDEPQAFSRFCQVFSASLGSFDILAVWFRHGENAARLKYAPKAELVSLIALEPYFHQRPWSRHLAGKRVLVISPFVETIRSQYARKAEIWPSNPEVLPEFQLDTLRCPLSAALVTPEYPDWFAALDAMRAEMDRRTYDVAIVGAGAWSVPLVAHAKQSGHWAIHLGGPTQILFGIRGGRWDSNTDFSQFFNSAWVRPGDAERPSEFRKVENGCYW